MARTTRIVVPPKNCSEQIVISPDNDTPLFSPPNITYSQPSGASASASASASTRSERHLPPLAATGLFDSSEWNDENPVGFESKVKSRKGRVVLPKSSRKSSKEKSDGADMDDRSEDEDIAASQGYDKNEVDALKKFMNSDKVRANAADINESAEPAVLKKQSRTPKRNEYDRDSEPSDSDSEDSGSDVDYDDSDSDSDEYDDSGSEGSVRSGENEIRSSKQSKERERSLPLRNRFPLSEENNCLPGPGERPSFPSKMPVMPEMSPITTSQQSFSGNIVAQKARLLARLERLKRNSGKIVEFNSTMNLEELLLIDAKVTYEVNTENTVRILRRLLLFGAYVAETMSKKFPWFDMDLQGYSEILYLTLDSYDEVLYNIYDENVSVFQCNAIFQLIMQFGSHMTMYSIANKFRPKAGAIPQTNRPDIGQNNATAAATAAAAASSSGPSMPIGTGMMFSPAALRDQTPLTSLDMKQNDDQPNMFGNQESLLQSLRREHEIQKASGSNSNNSSAIRTGNTDSSNVRSVSFPPPAGVAKKATMVIRQ